MDKVIIISVIVSSICLLVIGWFSHQIYYDYSESKEIYKKVEGLRLAANITHRVALDIAQEYDGFGDWVCINSLNMDYERCVEVASHECGHEIFAEILEKHPEKIKIVMGALQDE